MNTNNISVDSVILPNKPLSNLELLDSASRLNIPQFRGVFLRDTLPKEPKQKECGILNLDTSTGPGTHWVCWYKKNGLKIYFDSYGIQPPLEIRSYLGSPLYYNTDQLQKSNQVFCGHLCLHVLKELSSGKSFQDVINNLF